ncbi:hypothetical protein HPP92_014374 [Vanilla planifolia]|uniref:Inositol polyphosphate-related phosphatase domain-containing protein n=1 Tax=Vanilla planifolia TaxID=51239 RepID=A0A835UXK7_VANPL|nr:hypothetical protein HPP92_014374 [Vanilla planifolia]
MESLSRCFSSSSFVKELMMQSMMLCQGCRDDEDSWHTTLWWTMVGESSDSSAISPALTSISGKSISVEEACAGINGMAFKSFSPESGKFASQAFRFQWIAPNILAFYVSFHSAEDPFLRPCLFPSFPSTWNVGGRSPHIGLNLDDFLPINDGSDVFVLGFQEIVPLNAGNVLVIEDTEPVAKWNSLVDQTLNRAAESSASLYFKSLSSRGDAKSISSSSLFRRPSLNPHCKNLTRDQARQLRLCNCPSEKRRKGIRIKCLRCQQSYASDSDDDSEEEDEEQSKVRVAPASSAMAEFGSKNKYSCIVSKQMVGIFVTIWAKQELVQHISHLQISSVGRGIMGCLGNKGCISVSMSLHQTTVCFICSHLTSGEKEGDELKRNSDVKEILKNTRFQGTCKSRHRPRNPEKILEHDRVFWLGDLNYRIALSYRETKSLLEENNWNALLEKRPGIFIILGCFIPT